MRALYDYILVKIEKEYEDETVLKDGTKITLVNFEHLQSVQNHNDLHNNPANDEIIYNPNDHKRLYGTVVSAPEALTQGDMPIYFGETPKELSPEAQNNYDLDYLYRDAIKLDVKPGDKLYFLHKDNDRDFTWVQFGEETLLQIDYKNAVCVIRNGELIPIGGFVLIEPYYGPGVERVELHKGTFIYSRKTASGLEIPVTEPLKDCGMIKYAGEPLEGLECQVKAGDIVRFPEQYAIKMPIENHDYFVLYQHEILAILDYE